MAPIKLLACQHVSGISNCNYKVQGSLKGTRRLRPDSKAMIWQVRSGARIWVVPHATVTATGSGTEPEGPVIVSR